MSAPPIRIVRRVVLAALHTSMEQRRRFVAEGVEPVDEFGVADLICAHTWVRQQGYRPDFLRYRASRAAYHAIEMMLMGGDPNLVIRWDSRRELTFRGFPVTYDDTVPWCEVEFEDFTASERGYR